MPPEQPAAAPSPSELDLLAHTILTALTIAKGRVQVTRRQTTTPDGLTPALLDAALAEIDRAVTAAALDAATLFALVRTGANADRRGPEGAATPPR